MHVQIRDLSLSQFFGTFFGSPSWVSERRNILIREPITSPTGVKYEWNDEKKDYFNEKDEILPEEGFHHEGVCYNYNIETNSWMADGKPLQTSQSQTYKDENGIKTKNYKKYFLKNHKNFQKCENGNTCPFKCAVQGPIRFCRSRS